MSNDNEPGRRQPSLLRAFVSEILGILTTVAAPFVLIFLGAGMVGVGLNYQIGLVGWTGAAILAAGVLWGALLFLFHSGGDWW